MSQPGTSKTEGWTWLTNSRKWHYFRDMRSLCGKFALFIDPSEGYDLGSGESKDDCAGCRKALQKETP